MDLRGYHFRLLLEVLDLSLVFFVLGLHLPPEFIYFIFLALERLQHNAVCLRGVELAGRLRSPNCRILEPPRNKFLERTR